MIIETKELDKVLLKTKNKIVGTINGTFDLLHKGHIDGINQARNKVDYLFIIVNDDISVKRYKGPSRPVENTHTRLNKLDLEFPDCYILYFSELTPIKILQRINPNIHFISEEWKGSPIENYFLKNSKIRLIKKNFDISTSIKLKTLIGKEFINRAVFLDRDGTITKDRQYNNTVENFSFLENSINGMVQLTKLNYKLIVVTNQSAVSKGIIQKKDALAFNNKLISDSKNFGIKIDQVYTSFSENDSSPYRKPNIKFLELAADKFGLSLSKCWFIGDKESDMLAGKLSNTKTIFIGDQKKVDSKLVDYYSKDLYAASKIILDNSA